MKGSAEETEKAGQKYARSLIEASMDPLVTISADGRIQDVNAATEMVTGNSRRELIGTDFSGYFTEPQRARAVYEKVLEAGSIRDFELALRHRDGHLTPVLYNASVYKVRITSTTNSTYTDFSNKTFKIVQ